jgi:hypothetical protein
MSNQIETVISVDLSNRNKTTVFWRGVLAFPVVIFLGSFTPNWNAGWEATGVLVIPVVLALLVRGVYPSYVLSFNHALIELETRVSTYVLLLNDDYPSIERNPRVTVTLPEIDGGKALNPWLPLVKWLLAIPLYIVGVAYALATAFATVIAWIQTSFTGEYPAWAAEITLGTIKYWNRIYGYMLVMVTDEYPSFKL